MKIDTIIDSNGEEIYQYMLPEPEGSIYSIPKKEFDVIEQELYFNWETILNSFSLTLEEKQVLGQTFDNGVMVPPVDTKIYSFSKEDGTHWARIATPKPLNKELITPLSQPLTHHFLVQEYEDKDTTKIIFFGALEKQVNKEDYIMHRENAFSVQEGIPLSDKKIKNNAVYNVMTQNENHVRARTNKGEIVDLNYTWKGPLSAQVKHDMVNYFSKALFKAGVLPIIINTRVKYFFAPPYVKLPNVEALLIKTRISQRNLLSLDGLVLHQYSTILHHFSNPKNRPYYKHRTLMPYLGKSLEKSCVFFKLILAPPPKNKKPSKNTAYAYTKSNNVNVYCMGKNLIEKPLPYWPVQSQTVDILKHIREKEGFPDISIQQRASIAKAYCDAIQLQHIKKRCIVDIKPANFVFGEKYKSIIDNDPIINMGERVTDVTIDYIPREFFPKIFSSYPTVASDIYSTGISILQIFFEKQDEFITCLCKAMTDCDPHKRLSLPVVSNLLEVYLVDETYKLVDFMLFCFKALRENPSLQKYHQQMQNLGFLAKNISALTQTLHRPLSYLEQHILIKLLDLMPEYTEWNTVDNLTTIFSTVDNASAFIILGYLECLEKKKCSSIQEENALKTLIKAFFNTTQDTSNEPINNLYLDKFRQVQEAYITNSNNIALIEPEFLHKMILFFSKCWEYVSSLQEAYQNEPNKNELLHSIAYAEKAQDGRHSGGLTAVKNFVKTLLSDEFRNANQEKINAEKEIFLKEKSSKYRCGFFGFSSELSANTEYPSLRRQIFK